MYCHHLSTRWNLRQGKRGGFIMATNFKISSHQNGENLHLKLIGDFDGSSAWELLNVLKRRTNNVFKVIIHTNSLKSIYPFGRDTFRRNLNDMNHRSFNLLFTGENASKIAPEEGLCL
jgi:hypothetical protein